MSIEKKKPNIYLIASAIIAVLIILLMSWTVFLGHKETKLKKASETRAHYAPIDTNSFGFDASNFGKMVKKVKDAVTKAKQEQQKEIELKPVLTQLHAEPVVGLFSPKNTQTGIDSIYFVERGSGHAYKISILEKPSETRILHTTIPNVQNAIFVEGGRGIIRQYTNDKNNIVTIYNPIILNKDYTGEDPKGTYLTDNITALTTDANLGGEHIFYTLSDKTGVRGFVSTPRGENPKKIWSSWIKEWTTKWINKDTILLTQKHAFATGGASFLINTTQTNERLLIGNTPGLISNINNTGTELLYSTANKDGVTLNIKNLNTNKITKLPISTFADKCTWSNHKQGEEAKIYCFVPTTMPHAEYPDEWYQGLVSFTDKLWEIDPKTGETTLLLSPEEGYNTKIDAENPIVSESGEYIFFKNKSDQTLWTVKLITKKQVNTSTTTSATSTTEQKQNEKTSTTTTE